MTSVNIPYRNVRRLIYLQVLMAFLPFMLGFVCRQPAKSSGDVLVDQGFQAYDDGDYTQAIQQFELAIEAGVTEHDLAEIYTFIGNSHDRLDQFDEALAAHKRAVEIDPESFRAWNNLGNAYFYLGNLKEAETSHKRAINLNPEYAFAYASLGAVYVTRNEPEAAIQMLNEAIRLDETIATAHANLALAYALLKQFDPAESSLRRAITLGYENSAIIQQRIDDLKLQ
ncbi:MAG: tetratricopeptide repeat protein [Anaerolineae bacterium]|nr:tetratricopeptide repeat protein [Anaerolineae bacterium]